MDVGVYVTSLRTLKNLLLIGDAVKSVMFVAFQASSAATCAMLHVFVSDEQLCIKEDPYKLVLIAKDTKRVCVTSADFFFTNNELAIVTGDEDGIVRVYEYNPQGKWSF